MEAKDVMDITPIDGTSGSTPNLGLPEDNYGLE
jgi:hypothetical protein